MQLEPGSVGDTNRQYVTLRTPVRAECNCKVGIESEAGEKLSEMMQQPLW
jgi:hypothetical protein